MKLWLFLLIIVSVLLGATACGAANPATPLAQLPAVTSTPAPTLAVTTPTPPNEPAPATAAASQPEGSDWLTVEGKTADNLFYLGNPDAPVTLIDYSDFL